MILTISLLLYLQQATKIAAFDTSSRRRSPVAARFAAIDRRRAISSAAGSAVSLNGIFENFKFGAGNAASAAVSSGSTNEVVRVKNGIKHRRLGSSDIIVSEIGLGTQRWASDDFNAPDEKTCGEFMDEAILNGGVNLIDTAEQYPIPSGGNGLNEGGSEELIGRWMKSRKVKREDVVIATKITGGRNVTPRNIKLDCEGSLKRLQTDYIDVYQLHWPARYSPQANWGQSLKYNLDADQDRYWRSGGGPTSFEDLCLAMEGLIQEGKIRGWGLCNDNAYGLTGCTRTAKMLGTTPPCSIQGDFSLIDRKVRSA
mmetsp:Transcript_18638/g.42594  ORF Transcript_18638/g.42594 Transcript_18638/m.42594 type:complete len:313 (-) Transcript_18638:765-1703(-)